MNDDQRRARIKTVVQWGLALLAAVLIAPVIFLAVKGLVGLGLAVIVGLALVNFAPVLAMKFANWKVKAITTEARTNPIESRQNVALVRHQRLNEKAAAVSAFGTEVRNVADEVQSLRDHGQNTDADELARELTLLQQDFNDQITGLDEARDALTKYEEETLRLSRRWKASEALLRARGASGKAMDQELEKLVSQEATDAVNSKMNEAFARLDVDRATRRRAPQLVGMAPPPPPLYAAQGQEVPR